MMFSNGPEYEARLTKPFAPPTATLKQIHDAVPKHLLIRNPWRSTGYVVRDIAMAFLLFRFALSIDPWARSGFGSILTTTWQVSAVRYSLWLAFWWFQGLVGAGMFCLGHDASHGALFNSAELNNAVGFTLHTFLLIPYFAWRSTHRSHHKATGSIERDENYVPYTRSDFNLPDAKRARKSDYADVFEETPIWTLGRVLIMQGLGWWLYLTFNTMGSKMYPPGTSHWKPNSPLFKPSQREHVRLLLGRCGVLYGLISRNPGTSNRCEILSRAILVDQPLVAIVMFTYLHHSDPSIPHYRKEEWTFLRGATATVDRPLLGWMGRFFLHNISHDHIAHHFFHGAPFYNGPQITQAIRSVLKEDYNYDSTNSFYALWRSFTQCVFIEEEGGIVFYKNKYGDTLRQLLETR